MRRSPLIRQHMTRWPTAAVLAVASVTVVSCGDAPIAGPTTTGSSTTSPATAPTTPDGVTTVPATTVTTTVPPSTTVPLAMPTIWPGGGAGAAQPHAAAAEFVVRVLDVPPLLGPYLAGDQLSGEIEVFSPGDVPVARGTMLLRRFADGWHVVAIVNAVTTIDVPSHGARVPGRLLEVTGTATGFEANVSVTAYLAGTSTVLDREIVLAGTMGEPGPYAVTLDLSGASAGDVVTVLVRGGVGLETDPGELAAVAVVLT